MKWSMTAVGVFILGLIGVAVILLFQHLTTSSENDYYLLKEITESAMFDAIDISYYRKTGHVKIVREKFVENFTRRYAESTLFIGGQYIISFFDIMEEPPKVSLLINTSIVDYQIYGEDTKNTYDVLNNLTGIFEYTTSKKNGDNGYVTKTYTKEYYSMPGLDSYNKIYCDQPFYLPSEITQREIRPGSIEFTYVFSNSLEDILQAKLQREIDWVKAASEIRTNYFETIDTSTFATNCKVNNIYYYDCVNKNGTKNNDMICDKYNNFWLHWDGSCTDASKKDVLLKLTMNITYDEYEY